MDSPLEPRHDSAILALEFAESLGLLPKDIDDGVSGFAVSELVNDLMLDQVRPCSLLEFIQGSFKERSQ